MNMQAEYETMTTPKPTAIAPIGETLPQAGVIATRPATAAVAPPSAVGLPRCIHSIAAPAMTPLAPPRLGVMNAIQTLTFMRSAIAPSINAGVMIANIAWNMMKTYSGMLRGGLAKFATTESSETPDRPAFEKSPMKALPVPNARL